LTVSEAIFDDQFLYSALLDGVLSRVVPFPPTTFKVSTRAGRNPNRWLSLGNLCSQGSSVCATVASRRLGLCDVGCGYTELEMGATETADAISLT
jgi:hypothetical protein